MRQSHHLGCITGKQGITISQTAQDAKLGDESEKIAKSKRLIML
jgi:hypothetical protein